MKPHPLVGTVWRHKKRGSLYTVMGSCHIEATQTLALLYYASADESWWVRPVSEFLDGRFERVWPARYQCEACRDTGYKDYAAYRMDPCDHGGKR